MIRKYVRLRERNQITLPAEILEGLPVKVGDFLEISRTEDNKIGVRPTELVIMNTKMEEQEAKLALEPEAMAKAGEITSVEQLQAHLDAVKEKEMLAEKAREMIRDIQRVSEILSEFTVASDEDLRQTVENALRGATSSENAKFAG